MKSNNGASLELESGSCQGEYNNECGTRGHGEVDGCKGHGLKNVSSSLKINVNKHHHIQNRENKNKENTTTNN